MHPLKRLLQAHRPVFVAGMLGMERYDWFRNLLDPVFRNLIPARETDMETDTLLFFFPSRQNIAWAELETGESYHYHLTARFLLVLSLTIFLYRII